MEAIRTAVVIAAILAGAIAAVVAMGGLSIPFVSSRVPDVEAVTEAIPRPVIPPIDTAAPVETETATLALG
jgi:hypothetical protein